MLSAVSVLSALSVLSAVVVAGCGDRDRADSAAPSSRDAGPTTTTVDAADATPGADTTAPRSTDTDTAPPQTVGAEVFCAQAVAEASGSITDPQLAEISGVVAARTRPEALWVHNDSGAANTIWAIGPDGAVLARLTVDDAEAVDWEDIAIGAGSRGGPAVLYLADMGDNFADTRSADDPATIYRLPEPSVVTDGPTTDGRTTYGPTTDGSTSDGATTAGPATDSPTTDVPEGEVPAGERPAGQEAPQIEGSAGPAEAFRFAYADGAHDAEALIADPLTGDVFVITKQWDLAPAGLYRLPADVIRADVAPVEPTTVQRVADVADTAGNLVTAADISRDGTMVVVRTYRDVLLWDRDPERSVTETLAEPPGCTRAIVERQGEAVAFDPDGRGLVTIGEGERAPVNRLRVPGG